MDAQLLSLAAGLILAGSIAGVSAGLFGIGGGAVMVPALYYTFATLGYSQDVIMHMAVATSASVVIVTSFRSAHGHHQHKAVDWSLVWSERLIKSWGLWIGTGALLATMFLARYISGAQLTLLFGFLMSVLALQFIFGRPNWRLGDAVPEGMALPLTGTFLGGLCALMGIGFGSIGVTLMLLFGKRIHQAIGTAAAIGLFISVPATLGYIVSGWGITGRPPLSLGYVNFLGFTTMAIATIICVPIGVKLAHKLSQERLRTIFGLCLFVIAVNMIRKTVF